MSKLFVYEYAEDLAAECRRKSIIAWVLAGFVVLMIIAANVAVILSDVRNQGEFEQGLAFIDAVMITFIATPVLAAFIYAAVKFGQTVNVWTGKYRIDGDRLIQVLGNGESQGIDLRLTRARANNYFVKSTMRPLDQMIRLTDGNRHILVAPYFLAHSLDFEKELTRHDIEIQRLLSVDDVGQHDIE